MSCKLERPEPQELWQRIAADFSTTVLGGGDIIPESNEHYVVALNYAVQEQFFSYAESLWRERDPRYACCENLIALAAQDGIYRQAATPAQGYIKIKGKAGAQIRQDLEFEIGGLKFIPANSLPPAMPLNGEAVIMVKAQLPGEESNFLTSENGQILSPPEGIEKDIQLFGNLCGGSAEESCEELRARYLARLQYSPSADLKWIMSKVLEWPCVTDVCEVGGACCELGEDNDQICPDGLYLYVLFRNTFSCGIAPDCVIDEMNAWLFGTPQGQGKGQVPFGIFGAIRYVRPAYVTILIDGMACATSSQQAQVQERIEDYILRICPSQNLSSRAIDRIVAQVVGDAIDTQIHIEAYEGGDSNTTDQGLYIDECGNVNVNCDYKVCLHEIRFVNMSASNGYC